MSFAAKWRGDCEHCEVSIEVGDECRIIDYDKKLIAHVKCPVPITPVVEVICEHCNLIHPGECF